jgi:hypothetical protein
MTKHIEETASKAVEACCALAFDAVAKRLNTTPSEILITIAMNDALVSKLFQKAMEHALYFLHEECEP